MVYRYTSVCVRVREALEDGIATPETQHATAAEAELHMNSDARHVMPNVAFICCG